MKKEMKKEITRNKKLEILLDVSQEYNKAIYELYACTLHDNKLTDNHIYDVLSDFSFNTSLYQDASDISEETLESVQELTRELQATMYKSIENLYTTKDFI